MTPFSKNPITFGWKQGIKNMTSVTCDSVEKINVRVSLYQNQNDRLVEKRCH